MVTAATVYEKLPKIFIGESGISIAEKEIASVICGLRRGGEKLLIWGTAVQPRTERFHSYPWQIHKSDIFRMIELFFWWCFQHMFFFFIYTEQWRHFTRRKNKKHPSCYRQKEHASAGEMTFLESKDRVCFLLKLSIVPGAAAVVLRGGSHQQQGSSQPESRTGPEGRGPSGHLPTAQDRRQEREMHSCGQMYSLWANKRLQSSLMALLPPTGRSEVLVLKLN